jgi:hypothetical protein
MSDLDPRIEDFLDSLKSDGRSSPAGVSWKQFHEFLCARKRPGRSEPPIPLILGASGEPDAAKHQRLSEQLRWALDNDCLEEAIQRLRAIPPDKWNTSPINTWHQHTYPY